MQVPTLDIAEVSAGGGSIAWIDGGGALRVGPEGAGAQPGPACYGRGGTRPTVTDANVVLGFINPAGLAGQTIAIDRDAAAQAIETQIARPLGLVGTVIGAAAWVVTLPFTLPSSSTARAADALVTRPGRYTFLRPIGQMDGCDALPQSCRAKYEITEPGASAERVRRAPS